MEITVSDADRMVERKSKGLQLSSEIIETIAQYRKWLETEKGANPKRFPDARIVEEVLELGFAQIAEFQAWRTRPENALHDEKPKRRAKVAKIGDAA